MLHDMIGVVTFGSALGTAVPLAHVMRCSIASNDKYKLATSSMEWYLQKPQVMLMWCCGMVESLVSHASSQG